MTTRPLYLNAVTLQERRDQAEHALSDAEAYAGTSRGEHLARIAQATVDLYTAELRVYADS